MKTEVEEGQRTIPSDEADEESKERKTHKVCGLCNPPVVLGESKIWVTLCGKRVPGTGPLKWGIKPTCPICRRMMWKHVMEHVRGIWSVR